MGLFDKFKRKYDIGVILRAFKNTNNICLNKRHAAGLTIPVIILLCIFALCGCTDNSKEDITALTEQQKEILTEEGLPLDYNSLTENQQMYLRMADEMLTYINEKYDPYDVHFTYLAYHSPELLDGSTRILVVPDGYDPSIDAVTVKMNDENESGYEDDYLDIATRIIYEKILEKHLEDTLPNDKFRVILTDSRIREETLPEISELDEEYVMNNAVSGNIFLFLSDDACQSNAELTAIASEFFTWMSENKFYGTPMIELCRNEGLATLNHNNISDIRIEYGISCADANVTEDGVFDLVTRDY